VEKILDKDGGSIIDKGESLYKIKIEKKVYDVYIKDKNNLDIKLIANNGDVLFEKDK
jgi:hypothetical protein